MENSVGQDQKVIRFGSPKVPGIMPVWYANEMGYFKREGVIVEISDMSAVSDIGVSRFENNELDMLGVTNTIFAGTRGVFDIGKWVYSFYYSTGGSALVARKGLTSLFDARGKKFSIIGGARFFVAWALKGVGLTLNDVVIQEDPLFDIAEKVRKGEVDFGYVISPHLKKLKSEGFSVVYSSSDELGIVTTGLVFSNEFIEARRQDGLSFLRAVSNVIADIKKDDTNFIDFVSREIGQSPAEVREVYAHDIRLLDLDDNIAGLSPGRMSMDNIRTNLRYISLFLIGGNTTQTADPDTSIAVSFVSELAESHFSDSNKK